MSVVEDTVKFVAHATPERHSGDLTLDDVYSPTNDDLVAVMAGMVEDCNRYFRTVQEQEQTAVKHTHKISELVVQNAALQAELEKAHLVTEMQSAELNECRTMLRDAEHGCAKRSTRNSMISIHELNEQLQIAATKYEREKSLREKGQTESRILREELIQCRKEKQVLLTEAAQQAQVTRLQTEAIKHVRDQAHMSVNSQSSKCADALPANVADREKTKPAAKLRISSRESVAATEDAAPHLDLASTPVRRLSAMPLQPIASDSPVPCTSKSQVSSAAQSGREHASLSTSDVSDLSPFNVEDNRPCGGIVVQSCMQDVQLPCDSHEHPLLPLGVRDIIDSPSLTQQLSTEDEQHAPGSVMCSQVFKCISAGLSGQMPPEYMAVPEGSTELSTAPSCVNSTDKVTSHPIEASTSNEVSENVLEAGGNGTNSPARDRHRAAPWSKISELRQDASPDADQPSNGIQSSSLLSRASLERQVSSVSLAESEAYPSTVAIVKCTTTRDTLPGELSTSISCASSCSHDENLHQSTVCVATDIVPPLSHRCENKTPIKHKLGESGKAVGKSPYASGLERSKGQNSQVRLAETHSKGLQVHHLVTANQVWRMGGSSIRVRPETARSKSALVTPSGLGLPVTPRRPKVFSPHKSRTPDMSRLLGTPQRTRPGTPQRSRRSSRGPCKLVRSSLEEFPSSRPCSQGSIDRRATIAPGTVLPSFKSDTKPGSCHQERQRWL